MGRNLALVVLVLVFTLIASAIPFWMREEPSSPNAEQVVGEDIDETAGAKTALRVAGDDLLMPGEDLLTLPDPSGRPGHDILIPTDGREVVVSDDDVSLPVPLAIFADLTDGWHPTAEGLYDQTTVQWSQPGFVELSTERARELLPIASDEIGTLPTTIFAVVGGFPSLEDCERAYESADVRAAHLAYIRNAVLAVELQQAPSEERTTNARDMLASARAARDAAEEQLWEACERATSYKNWRLCARLFREWSR